MMEGRTLVKKRIKLFPSDTDAPPSKLKSKGKDKATEPTIPHRTTFAFGFDFPQYCELEDQNDAVEDDEDEDEDDDGSTEKHAVQPTSFGARAMDIQSGSESARRPSVGQRTSTDDVGSSGFSPSSWKSRSPTFVGKLLKRASFSANNASTSAQSPEEGRRTSFLRRLSSSQPVVRPPLETRYDLPPSTNLYFADLQASVEYTLKVKLRRRGMRLNDS
jgi:hypothetical protein